MSDGLQTAPESHLPNQQGANGIYINNPILSDLHIAALDYCKRGWYVIPLHTPTGTGCSCRLGRGCPAVGKHPRLKNGLADASNVRDQVSKWWTDWPNANVGLVTGSGSGLVVLDLDNKDGKDGTENFAMLSASMGGMPATLSASTGNGEHLFFRYPGQHIKNSVSKLAEGVDVRGDGGYVVAAPSLYANGQRYRWKDQREELAELPTALLNELTNKENRKDMLNEEPNVFTDAPTVLQGERNDTLYKLGCALRGQQGMEYGEILSILLEYNDAKCKPALKETEVIAIVASVCQHPAEKGGKKSAQRMEGSPLYWFPFNTRDWFSDPNVILMTDYQTGWYIRLKALAWSQGGFLPADRNKLWRLAGAKSKKAFDRDCDVVLSEYIEVDVEGVRRLRHPKLTHEYANALEKWMKQKEAGLASKVARAAAYQERQAKAA